MTIFVSSLVTLMLAVASGNAPMNQPLSLIVEPGQGFVRLTVRGQSQESCEARYELSVESGKTGHINRSKQSGIARLSPDTVATVATVTVGNIARDDWNAKLSVVPCRGKPYELSANGANGH